MPPANLLKTRIKVFLWGTEIGTLTWNPVKNNSYFNFAPEYFDTQYDLCPITHPKNLPSTKFAIDGENEKQGDASKTIYQSLPPFIADSLPDKWGNAIFDKWFKENKKTNREKNPLTKLSFIGTRAMGALVFKPAIGDNTRREIDLWSLYQEALALETELKGKSVKADSNMTIESLKTLGTSPGGRQMKIIVSQTPDGRFVSGQTSDDKNNKHYIIKFNTPEHCLSEIEQTYYELAKMSGIEMTESRLIEIKGIRHFQTERFDRKNGERVFTQTLAAINPSAETYEDLFKTARKLNLPETEIKELYRRTAFNFLMNNTDDHRKNFSFMMATDGIWHLAPAYDLNFIISTDGNSPEQEHCMSVFGKFHGITIPELEEFGKKQGIKNPKEIINRILSAEKNFKSIATKNGINPYYMEMIQNQLDILAEATLTRQNSAFKSNGLQIDRLYFEKSLKGNIHMYAELYGKTEKFIISPKKTTLYQLIIDEGFNSMSKQKKKELFEKYILPKMKNKLGIN